MKKILSLVLCLVLALLCVGCSTPDNGGVSSDLPTSKPDISSTTSTSSKQNTSTSSKQNTSTSVDIPYRSGDNYIIYTDSNKLNFKYCITDNNGSLIDLGHHDYRGSFDISNKNGLLVLNYGYGGNGWHERYYDLEKGTVSRFFERPVASSDKLVAYFKIRKSDNKTVLIVRDIFDASVFYKEIERDFSDAVFKTAYTGKFSEDNKKLSITYPLSPKDEAYSETIILQ